MKNLPLVSVIIPTYNRSNVLARAINSVIAQSYKKWELLIVDDRSTDETEDFIKNNYLSDSRISFIKRPKLRLKGANACRNIGLTKANGKYAALLDSDDEWKNKHLETCIKLAQDKIDFKGCYSGAIIKKKNSIRKRNSRELRPDESPLDFIITDGFAPTPSLFMDHTAAEKVKFDENLQRHQDWDFFIRFAQNYSWSFNDQTNVVIYWPNDNTERKIDFASCITFYQKYQDKISKEEIAVQYLRSMYKTAVMHKNNYAIEFYRDELKKLNGGNPLALKFPRCYRIYRLTKTKLQAI